MVWRAERANVARRLPQKPAICPPQVHSLLRGDAQRAEVLHRCRDVTVLGHGA